MAETMRNHRLKSGCTLVPRQTQLSHSSGWGDSVWSARFMLARTVGWLTSILPHRLL